MGGSGFVTRATTIHNEEVTTVVGDEGYVLRRLLSEIQGLRSDAGELGRDVAAMKQHMEDIGSRFDKLNGSVARHEKDLNEMKLARAEEKGAQQAREESLLSKKSVVSFNLLADAVKGAILIAAIVMAIDRVS